MNFESKKGTKTTTIINSVISTLTEKHCEELFNILGQELEKVVLEVLKGKISSVLLKDYLVTSTTD